jgi:hypothetical protein
MKLAYRRRGPISPVGPVLVRSRRFSAAYESLAAQTVPTRRAPHSPQVFVPKVSQAWAILPYTAVRASLGRLPQKENSYAQQFER